MGTDDCVYFCFEAVHGEKVRGVLERIFHQKVSHYQCQWGCNTWAVTGPEVKPASLTFVRPGWGKRWLKRVDAFIACGALQTEYRAETIKGDKGNGWKKF